MASASPTQSSDIEKPPGNEAKESEVSNEVKLRHEWYQTDTHVVISVLLRGTTPLNVNVDIQEKKVVFQSEFKPVGQSLLEFNLSHKIAPSQSTWKQTPSKVEIKLKKAEGSYWSKLEDESGEASQQSRYPSSSMQKRDWDQIAVDLKKSEDEEQKNLSGEAAVNHLFQKIYADGSEEVRRAMNKSFMESGGTVLSTNWQEVGDKTIDVKPPEGMEFRKWEK